MPDHLAYKVTIGLSVLVASTLPSSVSNAQLIAANDAVMLKIEPSPLLEAKQVFKITSSQILRQIEFSLLGSGIIVGSSSDAIQVILIVRKYDSGSYLGFSKTARIEVDYRLKKPQNGPVDIGSDQCEATAPVDVQSAPDRNRTAVMLCLTKLGARLVDKLIGIQQPTLVR